MGNVCLIRKNTSDENVLTKHLTEKDHLRLCFARLERGSTIGHAAMG